MTSTRPKKFYGLYGRQRAAPDSSKLNWSCTRPKPFIVAALGILLVAAFLRISLLSTLPPGPHFDEAANILITRSIAFDGANLFPIANSYQGRESLYFYLNVPVFRLIGDDVFALRIASVWINLLTIAAAMGLGRVMFRGQRGWLIGLAIGVMMTISFHQIFMSRQAYRAVSLPLMQALGLLFLWRGLTASRRDWLWLALGGLFAGGAIYTYMASRLFPLWLGIGGLVLLWADRANWRLRLRQGGIFFGVMLLTMTPMLLYALENPDIFFQRLDEVTEGEVSVSLLESIRLHLEMFFIRGDAGNLRYNDPGRPYFTVIEGVFLLVGVGIASWRLFQRGINPTQRAAYVLILLSPLMVIPSVISVAGFPPSHMRSLGMVPLIFVLVAVGFEAIWGYMMRRLPTRNQPSIIAIIGGLTLILGAFLVRDAYLGWAQRVDLFYQADGDLALAADWLQTVAEPDEQVYVASFHREHPTWITAWDRPVTWLGGDSLFLPPPQETAIAVFAKSAPPDPSWVSLIEVGLLPDIPAGPDGTPAFWAYRLDASMVVGEADSDIQNPLLALIEASAAPTMAGETASVLMTWRIQQTPPYYRLRPVVNIKDANGATISSTDVFLLGTDSWRPGEVMIQRVPVKVPTGTPPGDYAVDVSWVDRDTDTFVAYINAGGAGGTTAQITTVDVLRPDTFPASDELPIQTRLDAQLTPGIRLLGWNAVDASIRPGEALRPVLFWQATPSETTRTDGDVQVQLVNETGDTIALPAFTYAPSTWVDGELVTDRPIWQIPADAPPGQYEIRVYSQGDEIILGTVAVEGIARLLDAPSVETETMFALGDSIRLHGYTLQTQDEIRLDLVWQAQQNISIDYKVFVHLLDADGNIIDQHDVMPQAWAYPTSLWASGEYVIDPYVFSWVDAAHAIRIGIYVPETGTRLPISQNNDTLENDFIMLTLG